jgi:PEP-CTERM motif
MKKIAVSAAALCTALLLATGAHAATNVAPTGTASQSSLWLGTSIPVAGAAKAIDGSTDGVWTGVAASNSLSHTDNDSGNGVGTGFAWWQVALTSDFSIENVVIWNRTDSFADRLNNFTVSVLDNGVVVGSVVYNPLSGLGPVPSVNLTFATPLVGDTVRVQLNYQEYLHLAEVQVMATPVPEPTALALMLAGLGVTAAVARRRRAA